MSTKPKKAQTKTKKRSTEQVLETAFGAKLYLKNSPLDTAIERGERLEKIVKLIEKRRNEARYYGSDYFPDDYTVLLKIYKLAKGA